MQFFFIMGIQAAGRLICQHHSRMIDKSTGNRHTLLLASGQLIRFVRSAFGKPHEFQYLRGCFLSFLLSFPGNESRYHHIFQSRELRQQLMELEYKADMPVTECGQFSLLHTIGLCTVDNHRTAIRHIQSAHNLKQSSFTRSTGTHNTDNLPLLYLQANPPQHL